MDSNLTNVPEKNHEERIKHNEKGCSRTKNKHWYVGIFIASVLLYTIVIAVEGAYPFGKRCFLTDDAYVQYNTMLRTLIEYVHSGDKSAILWNRGMGTDMYLTALYYLMSPFNIIALLMGEKHVELALIFIIVLKGSLVTVTGLYYFRNTTVFANEDRNSKAGGWVSFCCALAWGFCGYLVAYGQNIIWLDAIILMPLIALAVEKVNMGESYIRYILLLTLVFIFNFYYAFYVCMFIVVYYILLDRRTFGELLRNGLKLAGLSVAAVMLAGIVLVPAALSIIKAGDTTLNSSDTLDMWGDFGHYIVSFFPFKEVTNGYLYNNNNYCGTIVVLLLFVFVLSSSVSLKDKLKYAAVVLMFMLAANFLPLNYVFHGFVVPHGTGNRFAIILTFVMLMIAYRILTDIESVKTYAVVGAGIVGGVVFALSFTDENMLQVFYCYVGFLLVMAVSLIVMVLLSRKSIKKTTALAIIMVLWVAEICCNMVVTMKDKANEGDMIDNIHLSEWNAQYQMLNTDGKSRKTALLNDNYVQNSDVNWYSSMINGYYVNAFETMGMAHFDNVECVYDGATPLTAMMYNVRYVLTNSKNTNGGYRPIYSGEIYSVYEADELADWGFMTDEGIKTWNADENVAENQSKFLECGFGDELADLNSEKLQNTLQLSQLMELIPWGDISYDVAHGLGMLQRYMAPEGRFINRGLTQIFNFGDFKEKGIGEYIYSGNSTQYHACVQLRFTADRDMDLYVYSADNRDQAVTTYIDGEESSSVMYTSSGQLAYGGHVKKGQKVKVSVMGGASVGETAQKQIQLYCFNTALFDKVKQYITDETLTGDGFSGNTFKGHITAKKDGVLYLAFPYSDGYTIYVDGRKAEKILLGKGNMGVELSSGEHEIKLEYHTPGFALGIIISCAGLVFLVLICMHGRRKRKAAVK